MYPSGKMKRCMDCQRFYNVKVNSKRVRAHQYSPTLRMSHTEFLLWCRSSSRTCAFCGCPEELLVSLGLRSTIGLPIAALGVDRIDNARDYEIGNIQFCCFACNKAKGNVFSDAETSLFVGPGIAKAWSARVGSAPIPDDRIAVHAIYDSAAKHSCRKCGLSIWPCEPKTSCQGCAKYASIVANARRPRRMLAGPGLNLAESDFRDWLKVQDSRCSYCGVHEETVPRLQVLTQVGHRLRNLGIDRIDNDRGYEVGNLALCCYPCNKVKGNVFSDLEMRNYVGPAVGRAWLHRLAGSGTR
jgi:hypothetical protein